MLLSTPFKDLYPSADRSDSVLTFSSLPFPVDMDSSSAQRKRPRVVDATYSNPQHSDQFIMMPPHHHSVLDADTTVSALDLLHRHQILDADRLVAHHMERMRVELWARWREFLRRAAAAIAEDAARRVKAKEEEVEQARRLNAALEERARALAVEAHIWRDLAETNEAAAHALRRDLESALLSCHARQAPGGGGDDAESWCDNHSDEGKRRAALSPCCRACGEEEASVLLLPCRHLCLCPPCASRAPACPVCCCAKQCTVHVNLS